MPMLFNKRAKERIDKLEQTLKAVIAEAEARVIAAEAAATALKERPYLIDINRSGRVNVFMFARNGETITIETYGAMSDDIAEWKRKLLG